MKKSLIVSCACLLLVACGHKDESETQYKGFLYRDFSPLVVEMELPDTPFFNDCVDMYNGWLVKTSLFTNLDWWFRCEDPEGVADAISTIDAGCIKNHEVRNLAKKTLSLFNTYFSEEEPTSYVDDENLDRIMDVYYQYDSLLNSRYNTYVYVNLSNEEYWETLDIAKAIPNYTELYTLDHTDENAKKIYHLFKDETDFERKCAYAQLYVLFADVYGIEVSDYEELLDEGLYSHRLFFLWRIWRCAVQLTDDEYGASTWSPIANELYNRKRAQLAITTLKYLKEHPDDKVAINQYVMLCSIPNIYRAGDYPYGNESFTEMYNLGLVASDGEYEEEIE